MDLSNLNLKYKPFPSSLLEHLWVLKLWNAGLVASAGEFKNEHIIILDLVGNDFSDVKLKLGTQEFHAFFIADSNINLSYNS